LDRLLLVLDGADVPAAQAQDRDVFAGLAERPRGQPRTRLVVGRRGTNQAEAGPGGQRGVQELAASVRRFGHGCSLPRQVVAKAAAAPRPSLPVIVASGPAETSKFREQRRRGHRGVRPAFLIDNGTRLSIMNYRTDQSVPE